MNLNLRIYESILSSSIVFPRSDYIVEKIFTDQKIQLNLGKKDKNNDNSGSWESAHRSSYKKTSI